jgi:hypothetical protein
MEATSLDQQITAYSDMLPEIRSKYGSVWALIVDKKLVSTFSEFRLAARYVVANHISDQVLIRHTDERLETAPFVQING